MALHGVFGTPLDVINKRAHRGGAVVNRLAVRLNSRKSFLIGSLCSRGNPGNPALELNAAKIDPLATH